MSEQPVREDEARLSDADAPRVIQAFTEDGGVFNTRTAGLSWQAQGVRGGTAMTAKGDTLGNVVQQVCDALGFDWKAVVFG